MVFMVSDCTKLKGTFDSRAMRNGARTRCAHDLVRMAAVAPVQKKCYKLSRPKHDDRLSDSDDEEPKKIRSYIKPNKNINTYECLREDRLLARITNRQASSFGNPKRHAPTVTPVHPVRREKNDTNSKDSRAYFSKQPKFDETSHHSSSFKVKDTARAKVAAPSFLERQCPTSSIAYSHLDERSPSAPTIGSMNPRKSPEEASNSIGVRPKVGKSSFKARSIPKPPPLPKKRSRLSSMTKIEGQEIGHHPSSNEASSLIKKFREARTPSATLLDASNALDSGTSHTAGTTHGEKITWNEHLNLAHMYKGRAKIFTLGTLPAEEAWYVELFESSLPEDRSVGRRLASDSVCDRDHLDRSMTNKCTTGKNIAVKKNKNLSPVYINSISHQESSCDFDPAHCTLSMDCTQADGTSANSETASVRHFSSLYEEEKKKPPKIRSCLATATKRKEKKSISFSEDLVSTCYYESLPDTDCQENQWFPLSSSTIDKESELNRNTEMQSNFEEGLTRNELCERTRGSSKGDVINNWNIPPLVKQEEKDDDDEIEVLFCGKTKYIEELRGGSGLR
ncbi:hypothetical protein RB195_011660 [Necator americanus]|uniref:Uncharacterized protein n=1 Tax=Necator americanus TaxID=51031 RepID=A0ABR1D3G8_NECAM